LPSQQWALPFAPRALVMVRGATPPARTAAMLRRAYRLTLAEADIAVRLASGAARAEIAAARGVSTETLKVQLRSIYEKTGCSREAQLVRLVGLFGQ
jgi:DNA-binding CsgD family transcriptional regulator